MFGVTDVLILVLMENTLRECGYYGSTNFLGVLILVLMENTLRAHTVVYNRPQ